MEEENKFPKSAKELYDNLMKANKLNAIKITMKAVEKLYSSLLEYKDVNEYGTIWMSIVESNDENDGKGVMQYYGTCPNCGNGISPTGGTRLSYKAMGGYEHGMYCLNCGKIYGKEGRKRFIEIEKFIFHKTILKS